MWLVCGKNHSKTYTHHTLNGLVSDDGDVRKIEDERQTTENTHTHTQTRQSVDGSFSFLASIDAVADAAAIEDNESSI